MAMTDAVAGPMPSVTEEEFALLVRRTGLPLDAAQRRVLHEVFGHFEAMLERNRTAGRTRGAEPAHVFIPGQDWRPA